MNKKLVAIQSADIGYDNIIKVEWHMGLRCNFKCTYCAETNKTDHFVNAKLFKKAVDKIATKFSPKTLVLLLTGGEPAIHPEIEEIVKIGNDNNIQLEMITNGSKNPDLYIRMLPYIYSYTFSVHFEQNYAKTINSINCVQNEIEKLKSKKIFKSLQVNIMFTPGYLNEIKSLIYGLKKRNIKYIIRRIRPLFDKNGYPILPKILKNKRKCYKNYSNKHFKTDFGYYDQAELNFLKKNTNISRKNTEEIWQDSNGTYTSQISNANDVLAKKNNIFKDWICWAGLERLQIMPDGELFRSSCREGGTLGNIYNTFELPSTPIICTKKRCSCAWAINMSKCSREHEDKLRVKKKASFVD